MTDLPESVHTRKPQRIREGRNVTFQGEPCRIVVTLRHDDEIGNGHNTFAITAEIATRSNPRNPIMAGCCHRQIARFFPEYAHMIRWHLVSTDGPLHYPRNPMFLAGDRDCWGRRKGEPSTWETWCYVGTSPVAHRVSKRLLQVLTDRPESAGSIIAVPHPREPQTFSDNYYFGAMGESLAWHEAPFSTEREAREWAQIVDSGDYRIERVPVAWSEGKAPEVEAARISAVWPGATVEQLTDESALMARLPGLLMQFKSDIEALGFTY